MISQKIKNIFIGIGITVSCIMIFLVFYNTLETERMKATFAEFEPADDMRAVSIVEIQNNRDNFYIVDVREPEEYVQGHFKSARHIPLGELLAQDYIKKEIVSQAGDKTIVFFCHDGLRSKIAAQDIAIYAKDIGFIEKGFDQMKEQESVDDIWEGSLDVVVSYDVHEFLSSRKNKLNEIPKNTTVVDMTWDQVYEQDGTQIIEAPIMRLPQETSKRIIQKIGEDEFVVICNSRMSCFYAKLFGYRAVQSGKDFLGYFVAFIIKRLLIFCPLWLLF